MIIIIIFYSLDICYLQWRLIIPPGSYTSWGKQQFGTKITWRICTWNINTIMSQQSLINRREKSKYLWCTVDRVPVILLYFKYVMWLQGSRRFKESQRREETVKVMRVKAAFVVGEKTEKAYVKGWWTHGSQQKSKWARTFSIYNVQSGWWSLMALH